jgi:hypothetical protein
MTTCGTCLHFLSIATTEAQWRHACEVRRERTVERDSLICETYEEKADLWRMTWEQWQNYPLRLLPSSEYIAYGGKNCHTMDRLREVRKDEVILALRDGKPVPSEVLADFPDLSASNPKSKIQNPQSGQEAV